MRRQAPTTGPARGPLPTSSKKDKADRDFIFFLESKSGKLLIN
jgi:hypothetical protein